MLLVKADDSGTVAMVGSQASGFRLLMLLFGD
jgi:hypothetical protein